MIGLNCEHIIWNIIKYLTVDGEKQKQEKVLYAVK